MYSDIHLRKHVICDEDTVISSYEQKRPKKK